MSADRLAKTLQAARSKSCPSYDGRQIRYKTHACCNRTYKIKMAARNSWPPCSQEIFADTIVELKDATMTDYEIQPNTRQCSVTGRPLQVGERFYTALLEEGDHFMRKDFCQEAWQGPPPGTFGCWSGRVAPPEDNRKPRFDDDLLEECFHRLEGQADPDRVNFRYVVALLLIRRRRLKFEQTITQHGEEKICVRFPRTGEKYQVTNPRLTEEEMGQVQEEVFKVLGWH
jgi:hypothetical protein